jgi:hypothetical protein
VLVLMILLNARIVDTEHSEFDGPELRNYCDDDDNCSLSTFYFFRNQDGNKQKKKGNLQ